MKLYYFNGWSYLNIIRENQFKKSMKLPKRLGQVNFQLCIDAGILLKIKNMH
jgi:hypothetical protein